MNRRSFLKGILAAGVAPYVVTSAGVLMPVRVFASSRPLVLYGDGMHDDTAALQAVLDGKEVVNLSGLKVLRGEGRLLMLPGTYLVSSGLVMNMDAGPIELNRIEARGFSNDPILTVTGSAEASVHVGSMNASGGRAFHDDSSPWPSPAGVQRWWDAK